METESERRPTIALALWTVVLIAMFIAVGSVLPRLREFTYDRGLPVSTLERSTLGMCNWNGKILALAHPIALAMAVTCLVRIRVRGSHEERLTLQVLAGLGATGCLLDLLLIGLGRGWYSLTLFDAILDAEPAINMVRAGLILLEVITGSLIVYLLASPRHSSYLFCAATAIGVAQVLAVALTAFAIRRFV